MPFWVGDDIEGARVSGDLSAWSLLEVRVVQHSPEDALRFSINGMVLEPDSVSTVRRAEDSMDQLTRYICHMRVHIHHRLSESRGAITLNGLV